MILKDALLDFDGNDLSAFVRSVEIDYGVEEQDDTRMGDNTRSAEGGLFTWTMSAELYYGEASGEPNAVLFALVGTTGTIIVRSSSAAQSATNPSYTGTALLLGFPPLGGPVGDEHVISANWTAAGDLSRAT